jgi:hypothetical protein
MDAFPVEPWRDLYVMLGTSSAALVGLLFVAASLHLKEVLRNEILYTRTRNITLHLIITLVQAAAVLTPQPRALLGSELVLTNLFGLWPPLSFTYRVFVRDRQLGKRGGFSIYRAANYIAAYIVGLAGGAVLACGLDWGMYLVTASYVNFLAGAIWNNWAIMFGVDQMNRAKQRSH